MTKDALTGIERELVLRYLIDGNVPVTVTRTDREQPAAGSEEVRPVLSEIFPIALKPEHMSILEEGIILLSNLPEAAREFEGQNVRVEFYFNRVGLYFISEMKKLKTGAALVIPAAIYRIQDVEMDYKYDFSAVLYYSVSAGKDVHFKCVPAPGFKLFSRPVWADIKLERQQAAKAYLEHFIAARNDERQGGSLHLISVCRYFAEERPYAASALQDRVRPFEMLFLNHERIVIGINGTPPIELQSGAEYALKMSFSMKDASAVTRDIYATGRVCTIFDSDAPVKAVDCVFTSIQKEDVRFLYEKMEGNAADCPVA